MESVALSVQRRKGDMTPAKDLMPKAEVIIRRIITDEAGNQTQEFDLHIWVARKFPGVKDLKWSKVGEEINIDFFDEDDEVEVPEKAVA